MSALPTLKEELDRKTVESIEWLVQGFQNGSIGEDQFGVGIDALFMATNGLVSEDVAQVLTEASGIATNRIKVLKRHLINGCRVVSISRDIGSTEVTSIGRREGDVKAHKVTDYETVAMADNAVKTIAASLMANGFTEL